MLDKLFSKANLHALAVAAIVGAATAVQSLLAAGTWTWHALVFGLIGGVMSAAAGWLIRQLNSPTPPPSGTTAALLAFLLLLLPLASCSPPQAEAAPVMAAGPVGLSGFLAPGDSLGPYTFTLPAIPGASGYKWTVTDSATNGAFPALPTGISTSAPTFTFTLPTGGAWDSVSLKLCVTGTSSVRSAKAPGCASWKVLRYLPSPTSLSGDSSKLGPISLMVRRQGGQLPVWGPGQNATLVIGQVSVGCVFWRFGSGHVLAVGADTTGCGAIAAVQFRPDRLTNYTAAEAAWQSGACLTWADCLSGLGLGTLRVPADELRIRRA